MNSKIKAMEQHILESSKIKFVWGISDCCSWVESYINRLGLSAKPYYIKYSTEKEANKIIKNKPVEEVIDKTFNRTLKPKRGDIAMLTKNKALGIVMGQKVAFKSDGIGVCVKDISKCNIFWVVK